MERLDSFFGTFSWNELDISAADISRAFGGRDKDIIGQVSVQPLLDSLHSLDDLQAGYVLLDNVQVNQSSGLLCAQNLTFEIGPWLAPRFRNLEMLAVVICSAGRKIDELSRKLMTEGNLLEGYIMDALGSVAVEKLAERIQNIIFKKMNPQGLMLTNLYHPGYCGWDLKEQKKIFSLLPENFCSVSLTDDCLMVPVKSTSALMGIGKKVFDDGHECEICNRLDCYLRKS